MKAVLLQSVSIPVQTTLASRSVKSPGIMALSSNAVSKEQAAANAIFERFKKLAGGGDKNLLIKALTGKSLQELPISQQARARAFLSAVISGKFTAPSVALAESDELPTGQPKAGSNILPPGVSGAFINADDGGTVMLLRALFVENPKEANEILEHEVGHAFSAMAERFGVKVAPGEDGARLRLAVDGKDPTDVQNADGQKLYDKSSEAKGTVVLNGKTVNNAEFVRDPRTARQITEQVFANLRNAIAFIDRQVQTGDFVRRRELFNSTLLTLQGVAARNGGVLPLTRFVRALGHTVKFNSPSTAYVHISGILQTGAPYNATGYVRYQLYPEGGRSGNIIIAPNFTMHPNNTFSLKMAIANALMPVEDPAGIDSDPFGRFGTEKSPLTSASVDRLTDSLHQHLLRNNYPSPYNSGQAMQNLQGLIDRLTANLPSTSANPARPRVAAWAMVQEMLGRFAEHYAEVSSSLDGRELDRENREFYRGLMLISPAMFNRSVPPNQISDVDIFNFLENFMTNPYQVFPRFLRGGSARMIDFIAEYISSNPTWLSSLLQSYLSRNMRAEATAAKRFPPPPPPPSGAAVLANNWPAVGLPLAKADLLPDIADFRKVDQATKMGRAANRALKEVMRDAALGFGTFVKNNPGTTVAIGVGVGALVAVQFVPGVNVAVDAILGAVGALVYAMGIKGTAANIKAGIKGFEDFLRFGMAGRTGYDINRAKNGFKTFLAKIGVEAVKLLALLADVFAVGKGGMSLVNFGQKAAAFLKGVKSADIIEAVAGGVKAGAAAASRGLKNFGKWFHDTLKHKPSGFSWKTPLKWVWNAATSAKNWLTKMWDAEYLAIKAGTKHRYEYELPTISNRTAQRNKINTHTTDILNHVAVTALPPGLRQRLKTSIANTAINGFT